MYTFTGFFDGYREFFHRDFFMWYFIRKNSLHGFLVYYLVKLCLLFFFFSFNIWVVYYGFLWYIYPIGVFFSKFVIIYGLDGCFWLSIN